MTEKGTVSLREKLSTLVKKFIKYMDENKTVIFKFEKLAQQAANILKDMKRALEVIFYFEGLGIITRVTEDHLVYVGYKGMIRKLYEYEHDQSLAKITANTELVVSGKQTNVKSYMLGGSLLGNIFYQLIYEKETTTKSSVEEMTENFMMQQKDLNTKNFVQEILSILTNLGLI